MVVRFQKSNLLMKINLSSHRTIIVVWFDLLYGSILHLDSELYHSASCFRSHFTIKSVLTSLMLKRLTRWWLSLEWFCSLLHILMSLNSLHSRFCSLPTCLILSNRLRFTIKTFLTSLLLNKYARWLIPCFLMICDFFHIYAALSHDLKRRTSRLDFSHFNTTPLKSIVDRTRLKLSLTPL